MADSKTYRVMLGFENGEMTHCAAVDYQGAVWLVPKWIPFPDEGYAKPERMIRLDQFRHQRFVPPGAGAPPLGGADFGINEPLPRALIDGELTSKLKERYVVLDKPDAKFRVGGVRH
jgi:hypothetical protein